MQPGVKRRGAGRGGEEEGAQHHPQGTGPGLSLFHSGLHCSGSKRKLESKKGEQQHQSNIHRVCSPEDGGKKPGVWREEAQPASGTGPSPRALWKMLKN